MKTLFTYGWTGKIIVSVQGSEIEEPAGSIIVDVPEGKKVIDFDLRSGHAQPIFEDIPKTEVEKLQEQNTKLQTYIENMSQVVDMLLTIIAQGSTDLSIINNALNTLKGGDA